MRIFHTSDAETFLLTECNTRLDGHTCRIDIIGLVESPVPATIGRFSITPLGHISRYTGRITGRSGASLCGASLCGGGLERCRTTDHTSDSRTTRRRSDLDIDIATELVRELESGHLVCRATLIRYTAFDAPHEGLVSADTGRLAIAA